VNSTHYLLAAIKEFGTRLSFLFSLEAGGNVGTWTISPQDQAGLAGPSAVWVNLTMARLDSVQANVA